MASDIGDIERRLWGVADQLRANSGLKPSEYSRPVVELPSDSMRRNGDIPMIRGKILNTLKRLDSHLSDAVYFHGCYLTGQQEEFCRYRKDASEDHPHGHTNIK